MRGRLARWVTAPRPALVREVVSHTSLETVGAVASLLVRAVPSRIVSSSGQSARGRGRSRTVAIGLAISGVALALRLHRLSAHDIWLDEAITLHHASTRSIPSLLFELPLLDPHPPLYFVVMNYWVSFAGTSEAALRLPSVIFGVAAVAALFGFVREAYDIRVATIAASLLAVSPFHVDYAQEARMYSLLALLTIVSMYFFVRLVRRFEASDRRWYVAGTALLGYTHVYGLFVVAAQVGFLVVDRWTARRRGETDGSAGRWVATLLALFVLLLPWIAVLGYRAISGGATPGDWLPAPVLQMILGTPVAWVGGVGLHPALVVLIPASAVAVLLAVRSIAPPDVAGARSLSGRTRALASAWAERRSRTTLLVIAWTVVPVVLGVLVSYLVTPIYYYRYTIVASLGFVVLVAVGVDGLRNRSVRVALAGLLVVGMAATLPAIYAGSGPEPWDAVTADIEAEADGDDLVIVSEVYKQAPFDYYWSGTAPTVRTVPERPGIQVVIRERYERLAMDDVAAYAAAHDDVWLVLSHVDPDHERELVSAVGRSKTVSEVSNGDAIVVLVGR